MRRTRLASRFLADGQPLCCALHPSGFLAAIGNSEGLQLHYVMRVSSRVAVPCCMLRSAVQLLVLPRHGWH